MLSGVLFLTAVLASQQPGPAPQPPPHVPQPPAPQPAAQEVREPAAQQVQQPAAQHVHQPAPAQQTPSVNAADVQFMSGMIPHHAQAVLIAGWAKTHTTNRQLQILCERIVVAQRDEIELMRMWLADRGLPVPAPDATHHTMKHGDMEHQMLMPGMLTEEELAALNKSRGTAFDKMFLKFMIKHHEGALAMVDELWKADGAAHDDVVFRFAADVHADQTTEIDVMMRMLGGEGE